MGAVFENKSDLHGKKIVLTREGKKRRGVLLAQDFKNMSTKFVFQWKSDSGQTCVSSVGDDELEKIRKDAVDTDVSNKE